MNATYIKDEEQESERKLDYSLGNIWKFDLFRFPLFCFSYRYANIFFSRSRITPKKNPIIILTVEMLLNVVSSADCDIQYTTNVLCTFVRIAHDIGIMATHV